MALALPSDFAPGRGKQQPASRLTNEQRIPLVEGADLNGTASGDSNDSRFYRPCRANPTAL
eukprot:3308453-Pleurochrysis_carterae.AAC.8